MTETAYPTTRGAMALLQPDLYYRSVTDVDLDELRSRGVQMLLLDLDNTLVPRNTTDVADHVCDWVEDAKRRGFRVAIVSNNWHERVQRVATALGIPVEGKGTKPLPGVFRRALAAESATPGSAAVVGDQIFTDILGGKFLGSTTVLVLPVARDTDPPHTRVLRHLERRILRGLSPTGRERADTPGE